VSRHTVNHSTELADGPRTRVTIEERDRLYFEAMMRVVDRELPGYRD